MRRVDEHIQCSMFHEIQDKNLFERAQQYGLAYLDEVFQRNVFPMEQALSNLCRFDEEFPSVGIDTGEIIDFLHTYGAPATVTQLGGRYFGLVCGSTVPAGLAAKSLATFWDQNAAMYVLSPLAAQMESVVEKWFRQLFRLPAQTVAGFVSGSSLATFSGLAAARYRLLKRAGWDMNEKGLFDAPKLRIVASEHSHASVVKSIGILGFGKANVEWVKVDDQGRMMISALPTLDDRTIVIMQAGNICSGSFDPFEEVCEQAHNAGAWVHVDGAFGMWAAAVERLQHLTRGIEKADSWAVDGHKTLNTPYDCGVVLCADREALAAALHMSASYIVLSEHERDGMFYTPDMSRRARVIELWATLKYLGQTGIDQMVYGMHERALQFAQSLARYPGFQVVNDVVFNQIMVKCETDELTELTLARIQELRECWVGGSIWRGDKVIRISVCSWATTEKDVNRSVDSFFQALEEVKTFKRDVQTLEKNQDLKASA